VTRAAERIGTENVLVAIDLGEAPTLEIVAQQADVLAKLYIESFAASKGVQRPGST
jgi:hypothetical protein